MYKKIIFLSLIIGNYAFAIVKNAPEVFSFIGTARDSYVNAHRATQLLNSNSKSGKINRESDLYTFGTADEYNTSPGLFQQQNLEYGAGKVDYGHPKVEYGPPKLDYGPPVKDFGSASAIYGPPPSYYHYVHAVPENSFGKSYSMILPGLLDKLKFKLNLFTIGKIILKLVIFKKIVSLLAILCLLMFLPTLKHDKEPEHGGEHHDDDDDDDDGGFMTRNLNDKTEEPVNSITGFIVDSINDFTNKYNYKNDTSGSSNKKCATVFCKSQVFLNYLNKNYSYKKLASAYLKEQSHKTR